MLHPKGKTTVFTGVPGSGKPCNVKAMLQFLRAGILRPKSR